MSDDAIVSALASGSALASQSPAIAPPVRMHSANEFAAQRTIVVGDPQAGFDQFLRILSLRGLLTAEGTIDPQFRLVSVGDHFDWGPKKDRARASFDGLRLLAWLASHPAEQVVILAGNHDLARVGELHALDDAQFDECQMEADLGYLQKQPLRSEQAFCEAWGVASWEVISRDFSAYRELQRDWVTMLLRAGRMQLAYASHGVLCTHAGVSQFELAQLGLQGWTQEQGPEPIADALNQRMVRALRQWREGPLRIAGLHEPGVTSLEGTGMFYHRFTTQPVRLQLEAPLRRKVSTSELPVGLQQCIGHVRDRKSRVLLELDPTQTVLGSVRVLQTDGQRLDYHSSLSAYMTQGQNDREALARCATVFHVDGAMLDCPAEQYQLLELAQRRVL